MRIVIRFVGRLTFFSIVGMILIRTVNACTRIFWNTTPDLKIVGRNEDFVTRRVQNPHLDGYGMSCQGESYWCMGALSHPPGF